MRILRKLVRLCLLIRLSGCAGVLTRSRMSRFHFGCVGLNAATAEEIDGYSCDFCQQMGHPPTRSKSLPPLLTCDSSAPRTRGQLFERPPHLLRMYPHLVSDCNKSSSDMLAVGSWPLPCCRMIFLRE